MAGSTKLQKLLDEYRISISGYPCPTDLMYAWSMRRRSKKSTQLGYSKRPRSVPGTTGKRLEWTADNIKTLLDPYNPDPVKTRCSEAHAQAMKARKLLTRLPDVDANSSWLREIQTQLERVARKCSR